MSIFDSHVIDWLGIDKDTGYINLTIVDDLDWSDEARHIYALQEKINSYLAFAESGEVYVSLSRDLNKVVSHEVPIRISILAKFSLSAGGIEFISYAKSAIVAAGFEFSFKVLSTDGAAASRME